MSTYSRRFAQIARLRRQEGRLGKTNRGNRCLIPGFKLNRGNILNLFAFLAEWACLELREGWRSWGNGQTAKEMEPDGVEVGG